MGEGPVPVGLRVGNLETYLGAGVSDVDEASSSEQVGDVELDPHRAARGQVLGELRIEAWDRVRFGGFGPLVAAGEGDGHAATGTSKDASRKSR